MSEREGACIVHGQLRPCSDPPGYGTCVYSELPGDVRRAQWPDAEGCGSLYEHLTHEVIDPPAADRGPVIDCQPDESIIEWSEVAEGDLVLLEDGLVIAERVNVYQDIWNRETGETFTRVDISYRRDGRLFTSEHHGDRLTAVRRYDTGED